MCWPRCSWKPSACAASSAAAWWVRSTATGCVACAGWERISSPSAWNPSSCWTSWPTTSVTAAGGALPSWDLPSKCTGCGSGWAARGHGPGKFGVTNPQWQFPPPPRCPRIRSCDSVPMTTSTSLFPPAWPCSPRRSDIHRWSMVAPMPRGCRNWYILGDPSSVPTPHPRGGVSCSKQKLGPWPSGSPKCRAYGCTPIYAAKESPPVGWPRWSNSSGRSWPPPCRCTSTISTPPPWRRIGGPDSSRSAPTPRCSSSTAPRATLALVLMRMSTLFLRTLREDPADAEVPSHRLLVRAGYIRRAAPGIYSWLPLGLRVLRKVERIIREEMAQAGAQEVHLPALLPREPYEATGRWEDYGPNLFRLQDRRGNDYLLAPTHEEMFTLLVKDLYSSYKDLPLTIYQIQTKYRDEARPRAGLLRGREFIMKDAYSVDMDEAGLDASYQAQRDAYERIFARLGLPYVIVAATSGAMGGSRSEEFLFPTAVGEDTFVQSPGGYTANIEAVTTPAPAEVDATDLPAPQVVDTPGADTIEALVAMANERFPRAQGSWSAADTLKHVVLALTHPEGREELVVIGVPGDREVDISRLAGVLEPIDVAPATDEQIAAHPELVPGYICRAVFGPNGCEKAHP